ncbi:hypothetical protein ACIRVF_41535 [Kitasatospora sp. NPDC101157]|uniref:hypothetical protein n=1 Tax=Kitasatospora sp. NPDC101157 TaxID=3364098 RepID=UPI003823B0B2
MTAAHVPLARLRLPVLLMRAGACLWVFAPLYALAVRPSVEPPRDQWGYVDAETAQLNDLVAGFTGFLIVVVAAAAVWAWAYTAVRLEQGSRRAPSLACVTALTTGLLAVSGARKIFHGLNNALALGVLTPLLLVSAATVAVTLRTWSRPLPATK